MSSPKSGSWIVSTDTHDWSHYEAEFPDRESAIAAGTEGIPEGSRYHVGRVVRFLPSVHAHSVLDQLNSDACGEVGDDHVDNWPDASKAAREDLQRRLDEVLAAWLAEHGLEPTFWGLEDVTSHDWPATVPTPGGGR